MRESMCAGSLPKPVTWLLAISRREELDGLIADGIAPSSCRLCEVRSRQLVKRGRRAAIAAEIEERVEQAAAGSFGGFVQPSILLVDLRLAEVRAAASELRALARALRSADPPRARGIAMALLLVRHGQSPLYVGYGTNDVFLAANAARVALTELASTPESADRISPNTGSARPFASGSAVSRFWATSDPGVSSRSHGGRRST